MNEELVNLARMNYRASNRLVNLIYEEEFTRESILCRVRDIRKVNATILLVSGAETEDTLEL